MKRWVWNNGRFGWPIIAAIVFATISLLIADFVWRTVILPFDMLLVYLLIGDAAAAAVIILAYQLVRPDRNARRGVHS